ncbi:MAG: hypothetical protein ACJ8F1_11325 [Polyangia bacterium]
MFGIIAKTIQYTAFFAKLAAHHVVVDEFDPSTNCARTTVVETGFPGNTECIDTARVPRRLDRSDVTFDDQPAARTPPPAAPPESDMPDVSRKGKI